MTLSTPATPEIVRSYADYFLKDINRTGYFSGNLRHEPDQLSDKAGSYTLEVMSRELDRKIGQFFMSYGNGSITGIEYNLYVKADDTVTVSCSEALDVLGSYGDFRKLVTSSIGQAFSRVLARV